MEKYKKAWKRFQNKVASLKRRQFEIFANITEKIDKQKMESIRKKLENHEKRESDN